jgi:hypothetical protein
VVQCPAISLLLWKLKQEEREKKIPFARQLVFDISCTHLNPTYFAREKKEIHPLVHPRPHD